jgi:hypothetical protein
MKKTLQQEVAEMRSMADRLVPLTFPAVTFKEEQEILLLKQRVAVVDGYEVIICFSKADYGEHTLESLQLQSVFAPFLPFHMVCKLGRAFLGDHHLSYIEFFKSSKKVYCWTVKTRADRAIPTDGTSPASFEGFDYSMLQQGSFDLF